MFEDISNNEAITDFMQNVYQIRKSLENIESAFSINRKAPENDNEKVVKNISEQPASVEISVNAKGQHQWTVKLIGTDLEDIKEKVLAIDRELKEVYKNE
jgi:hypothetical protein